MDLGHGIAEILLEKEAVQVRINPPFEWASGIKAPVYCDNRKMLGYVGDREKIVAGFVELAKSLEFDVVGGTATAAIPWAAFLAQELHKPMIYIRPEKKEHGAGKQIEGYLPGDQRVLIVEDLISTGASSMKAAQAVRDSGCEVSDVLAIVTWELPGSAILFEEAGLNLRTMTDYTHLIGLAAEKGSIPQKKLDLILKFKRNPEGWWDEFGGQMLD